MLGLSILVAAVFSIMIMLILRAHMSDKEKTIRFYDDDIYDDAPPMYPLERDISDGLF